MIDGLYRELLSLLLMRADKLLVPQKKTSMNHDSRAHDIRDPSLALKSPEDELLSMVVEKIVCGKRDIVVTCDASTLTSGTSLPTQRSFLQPPRRDHQIKLY